MTKCCIVCNQELTGIKRKFCSQKCASRFFHKKNREYDVAYNKQWIAKNREHFLERIRRYNRKYYAKWNENNKDKLKEYSRRYYEKNKKKINAKGKIWREKNKEYCLEFDKKYKKDKREESPKKFRAREQASYHISLTGKSCELCGSTQKLERHHSDYNKPLKIQILCEQCHTKNHHFNY
jgi:hypothetical protein